MQTTFRYAYASLNAGSIGITGVNRDIACFELAAMNSSLVMVEALRKIASGVTGGQSPESLARETVEALGLREVTRAP